VELVEELIESLRAVVEAGWVDEGRPGNDGSVGNTIEDLLGIDENNLSSPDLEEFDFELKTRSLSSVANVTLFHMEPFPRSQRFVPRVLLPHFGWDHAEAGGEHPVDEQSFRLTLRGERWTNRGFSAYVNRGEAALELHFDSGRVDPAMGQWLESVERRRGTLADLSPHPMWPLQTLYEKSTGKLRNTIFAQAHTRIRNGTKQFRYDGFDALIGFQFDTFVNGLREGAVVTEFDARTGHNHGTKFRVPAAQLSDLYAETIRI
jgi:MvaI/BcnI restriction endonuclease family protein